MKPTCPTEKSQEVTLQANAKLAGWFLDVLPVHKLAN